MTEFVNDEKICLENDLSPKQKKDILNKLSYHSKKNSLILNIIKQACSKKIKENEEKYNTTLKNQSKIFYFVITFLFFIILGLSIYLFIKR